MPKRHRYFESFSRELTLIDMEPILEDERRRCEKITGDLERARASLERHRLEGEPAFSLWINANFGEELSTVRELEAKAAGLSQQVARVEAEADRLGCSEAVAYARLEAIRIGALKISELRQADPADLAGELPEEVAEFLRLAFEENYGHVRLTRAERDEAFENFRESFRKDLLGRKERNGEQNRERERDPPPPVRDGRPRSKPVEGRSRLKQLYRDLARRLHPDLNPSLTLKERELWHEVQVAYESQNLDALETLAVLAENGEEGALLKIKSVSGLRAISTGISRNLKAAQRALKSAKLHPSWGFERATDQYKSRLANQVRRELGDDILSFEVEVEDLEARIARWEKRR